MDDSEFGSRPRGLAAWSAVAGAWTLLAVVSAVQAHLATAGTERPIGLGTALAWQLPQWWAWAALTPVVIAADLAARRSRRPVRALVLVHVPLACAAILAHSAVVTASDLVFFRDQMFEPRPFRAVLVHLQSRAQFEILSYLGLLGGWYAFDYFRRHQRESVTAARLEAELERAELRALEAQLHPHFLFNSLQAAAVLNRHDPEAGTRVLVELAELFRTVLETRGVQRVPLREEIDFVERYLGIERVRFADRLDVVIDVDPAAADALVPRFVLQPLVENALRHGIQPRVDPGRITVRARRADGWVDLEVADDGVGPGTGLRGSAGVGLPTTRRRLEALYGERAELRVVARISGGTRASVRLPYEPEGGA